MLDSERLSSLRSSFPVTSRYVFLNHAAVAPVSTQVVVAMNEYLTSVLESAGVYESRWLKRVEEARTHGAQLLGALPEEIAFVKNTTEGLLMVANGIRWREGDNVIVPSCEFPANIYPWRNLEQERAGFDLPLEQPDRFREILQFFVDMDEPTHQMWCAGAQAYMRNSQWLSAAVEQNRWLFYSAASMVNHL